LCRWKEDLRPKDLDLGRLGGRRRLERGEDRKEKRGGKKGRQGEGEVRWEIARERGYLAGARKGREGEEKYPLKM